MHEGRDEMNVSKENRTENADKKQRWKKAQESED